MVGLTSGNWSVPEILVDVCQDAVSDGDNERVVRLESLLVHVTAAVHEGHPGLLTAGINISRQVNWI